MAQVIEKESNPPPIKAAESPQTIRMVQEDKVSSDADAPVASADGEDHEKEAPV